MATEHERTNTPRLTDAICEQAMVLAMCVRNALEGTLHGGNLGEMSLTDEQMAILNPIVRNALATALHARSHYLTSMAARKYLNFQAMLIPDYWQTPELLEDYVEFWVTEVGPPDDVLCRRCGRPVVDAGGEGEDDDAPGGVTRRWRCPFLDLGEGWDDHIPS